MQLLGCRRADACHRERESSQRASHPKQEVSLWCVESGVVRAIVQEIRNRPRRKGRAQMKLISVSTGLPRETTWHGRTVTTGIFKQPIDGRVALRQLNFHGYPHASL